MSKEIKDSHFFNYTTDEIQEALSVFGLTIRDEKSTDPVFMKQLLKEINLNFEAFSEKDVSGLLHRLMNEKITLKPLKESILLGIKNNFPLCKTIIEAAKLPAYKQMSKTYLEREIRLKYSIYFLVILEVLTHIMTKDKEMEEKIFQSILDQPNSTISKSIFRDFFKGFWVTGNFIEPLKCMSITPSMLASIFFGNTMNFHLKMN